MFTYRAIYQRRMGAFFAELPDFPEATAFGPTLEAARTNLASSLRYAAEARLRRGDTLPLPDENRCDADAYLLEPMTVRPDGTGSVLVESPR